MEPQEIIEVMTSFSTLTKGNQQPIVCYLVYYVMFSLWNINFTITYFRFFFKNFSFLFFLLLFNLFDTKFEVWAKFETSFDNPLHPLDH